MTWTTARPTQAGWYWFRECCPEDERPVRVQINAQGTFVQPSWGDYWMEIDEFSEDGEWQGPIEPHD